MGTFVELIKKDLKQKLDEQVAHLKSLSEDESLSRGSRDTKEWRLLFEGAETVINILEHEIGRNEHLDFILKGLDRTQLKKIASLATSKVVLIESEPKITLWGVCYEGVYQSWHMTYKKAKAAFISTAEEELDLESEYEAQLEINKKQVFESEVSEYLNL